MQTNEGERIILKENLVIFLQRLKNLPNCLNKKEKIVILSLLGIILISSLISIKGNKTKKIIPNFNKTFVEGEVGDIRCLVPILPQNDIEKDISRLIFSSLIKFNDKREIVPDLAEKWEIAPDGKTYTFVLKNSKWQDGEKITADDVVFTFSQIKNSQIQSQYFDTFSKIEVAKKDDRTVSFSLPKPYAPFLSSLTVPILPKHALSTSGRLMDSPFAKKPIGSGPFKLDKIEQNRNTITVTLKSNSDYFGGKPKLDKFIFNIYASIDEAETAFVQKDIQGLLDGQQGEGKFYQTKLPNIKALNFNLDKPYLTRDLRKALALAINRDEILSSGISGEKIYFPILPGFLGYPVSPSQGGKESEKYDFNLEQAKKSFAKAKNKPADIVLLAKFDESSQKIAEILKKEWEPLGIKIDIQNSDNGSDEYDIVLTGVNQKADPDPYPFWHSSQIKDGGLNFSNYKNKEVDKLLEDGRQTLDNNVRQQKYEKFVDIISADVPAIFLYQNINKYHVSDNIEGVGDILGVTGADRFNNIINWDIK